MADERDLELLDDYLSGRMSEQGRSAFEKKLRADPDLESEHALQKRLIQGIKDARVAELKSMLNKVPVPPKGTGSALAAKVVVGTMATLLIAAAAYWYMSREQNVIPGHQKTEQEPVIKEQPLTPEPKPEPRADSPQEDRPAVRQDRQQRQTPAVEQDKNQTSAGTEHSRPSLAKRPDPVPVPEPKEKASSSTPLVVATDSQNDEYRFHYAFKDGGVVLYGPFEEGSYQVVKLQVQGEPTLFLSYNDKFYHIDPSSDEIRPLEPVMDNALLQQLKELQTP